MTYRAAEGCYRHRRAQQRKGIAPDSRSICAAAYQQSDAPPVDPFVPVWSRVSVLQPVS